MSSKKKVVIAVVLFCMVVAGVVGRFGFRAEAEKAKVVNCEIKEKYAYGDKFILPAGDVSYKGEEKPATSKYIIYPSGKANDGESIVLSEEGQYSVVYQAEYGGTIVEAKETFKVDKSLLSVSSDKSSAKVDKSKIQVSIASEDVFTYNKALDLSTATKETPLLDMEVHPHNVGTPDALIVKLRFTDLYEPENHVTLTIKCIDEEWAVGQVYITAGAANQSQVGVENLEDATKTNIHVNDIFGTPAYFSMAGKPISSIDTQLKLYFDYEEKTLYVDREIYSGGQKRMIVDLDDSAYFGTEVWDGFTTGEVKMTAWAENYQSSSCNLTFNSINGETDFAATGDDEGPKVTIFTGYKEADLPKALVGKPYKLFEARAIDKYDGETEVIASAYYKYYSEKPIKLAVTDGTFTPEKEGVYTLEYKTADASGNVTAECVKVYAVKSDGLKVKLKDAMTETTTGSTVKVVKDITYSDNSGKVEYQITAKNTETEEVVEINSGSKEFTPMSDGNWEITVEVNDYVSSVEKTFNIKSNHTTQPQVYDKVAIQQYFILGATYELPVLKGYDFSSGKGVETGMSVFVSEKGGKETEVADGKFVPSKVGNVKVVYRLTVDGLSCEKTYEAKVVDVGYTGDLSLDKYFVTTKGSTKAAKEATNVTYSMSKDAKLDFVNFVQTKKLEFSFQVGKKNKYNRINVYLKDSFSGKQVKLSYRRTEAGTKFSINDGVEVDVASSFTGMDRNFALTYNNDTHMLSAANGTSLKLDTFSDGSTFKGFTDSVAFFAIEVADVKGDSELIINSLNGQSLNNTRMDRFAPQVLVATKSGDRGLNETVILPGAFVYDTLDPISNLTLTVTDPKGDVVTDEEGIKLDGTQDVTKDATIKLSKYGDYTIRYVAEDGKGKSTEYVYAITAKDTVAPTVTLKRHKTSAEVGAEVKVAKAEAEDNVTKKCTISTYVFDPQGVWVPVTDGKFEATMQGAYTVRYMVSDKSGNYTFTSYEIDVKE